MAGVIKSSKMSYRMFCPMNEFGLNVETLYYTRHGIYLSRKIAFKSLSKLVVVVKEIILQYFPWQDMDEIIFKLILLWESLREWYSGVSSLATTSPELREDSDFLLEKASLYLWSTPGLLTILLFCDRRL